MIFVVKFPGQQFYFTDGNRQMFPKLVNLFLKIINSGHISKLTTHKYPP